MKSQIYEGLAGKIIRGALALGCLGGAGCEDKIPEVQCRYRVVGDYIINYYSAEACLELSTSPNYIGP